MEHSRPDRRATKGILRAYCARRIQASPPEAAHVKVFFQQSNSKKMSYLKISDQQSTKRVELYYEDWGHGQPVVLIHGWPLSHEMWEYQVGDLVDAGFRVVAYDRRGFGKSSKPYDGYDYDTLADDLRTLMEDLDLRDVTLVGFSMGGGEVVRYFSRHRGERVSRAVLISSVTPHLLKSEDNPNGVPQSVFEGMITGIKEDRLNFLDTFGKVFFGVNLLNKPISVPLLEYYRALCSIASPRATIECVKAFAYTDFLKDMRAVNVPTLIIHGDADKTVPIEPTGNQAAKLIPDSQYIIYEGAHHGLFYSERERLNTDLIQFIRESVSEGVH